MSLINYWPRPEYINECIRTEAEELAEHVLLAVHEPMQLLRVGAGEDQWCSEEDLLEHFLSVERPIPIIGKSGVGKSHLIRWMDAKLKLHADYAKWHVVRIPKNSSLRQALEILLDGLQGDDFDEARKRIHSVGEQLKTEEVADLLLTFMSQQLQRMYQGASLTMDELRERPELRAQLTDFQKERLRDIQKYTLPGQGLSELITDPNFKKNLLSPKHCIYQSASRLTQGASDDELGDNNYEIKAKDLDFSFNLDDLSLSARQCVSKTRLTTELDAREGAARVLNEVLGESTRTVFRHLFQFNGGSFQDLFKSIRRSLKVERRTLVVLVEDMAAISAIEDVLIDSLLEESVRDGEQELCTLRSAIAVTDGYQGYLRRQDTIKTRAQYEWNIRDYGLDRVQTLERIIDFCGRYLNAARYGSAALKTSWLSRGEGGWPQTWSDPNDGEEIRAFGYSPSGAPLFPFNRNAITALADHFCRKGDEELKFNPRQILNEILLRTLRDYRKTFEVHEFPPAGFAGISVWSGLQGVLQRLENPERSKTVAAIWGYGGRKIEDIQSNLDRGVASAFGLGGLAAMLKDGVVATPDARVITVQTKTQTSEGDNEAATDSRQDKLQKLEEAVTLWFQRKIELGQEESRALRAGLLYMYEQYAHVDWFGLGEKPSLKSGVFVNIEIPYAVGNRTVNKVSFCLEKDFKNTQRAAFLQGIALALLRYEYFNPKFTDDVGWGYAGGFEDYLIYQNFAADWVPDALKTLAAQSRESLSDLLGKQVQSAIILGLMVGANNDRQRLNELLRPAESIREREIAAIVPELKQARELVLKGWDAERDAWLKLVSVNEHGMDGDIAAKGLKAVRVNPDLAVVRLANVVTNALQPAIKVIAVLEGCSLQDEFFNLLKNMADLVRDISVGGLHYPAQSNFPSAKKMESSLLALRSDSENWSLIKRLLSLDGETDVVKRLQQFNLIDGPRLETLIKVLMDWDGLYQYVKPRLESENKRWGGDILKQSQNSVTRLLDELTITVDDLLEASNESA